MPQTKQEQAIEYEDQCAAELCLHFIDGIVDVNQFTVVKHEGLAQSFVDAFIIGGSHCVTFRYNDLEVSEVFACTPVNANMILQKPLHVIDREIATSSKKADYTFSHEFITDFKEGVNRLRKMERQVVKCKNYLDKLGLLFEFPTCNGGIIPKTILLVGCNKNVITIESAHSYPCTDGNSSVSIPQGDIVFTTSQIIIKE